MKKTFTIRYTRGSYSGLRQKEISGTLEELTEYFGYTLLKGKSWEHERGNKKINTNPKTIRSLVTNLNNASNNAALNGYSGEYYEVV